MEKIIKKTNELVDEFLNYGPYIEHNHIKSKINDNPGLKSKLDKFIKASDEYEHKRLVGEDISFDEERNISSMYTELWLNEDSKVYLETQSELCKVLRIILEIIENKCVI